MTWDQARSTVGTTNSVGEEATVLLKMTSHCSRHFKRNNFHLQIGLRSLWKMNICEFYGDLTTCSNRHSAGSWNRILLHSSLKGHFLYHHILSSLSGFLLLILQTTYHAVALCLSLKTLSNGFKTALYLVVDEPQPEPAWIVQDHKTLLGHRNEAN